jgi:phenylacetaldehyde dehydrogenase
MSTTAADLAGKFLARRHALLIDGRCRAPREGGTFPVLNPATGDVIAQAPEGRAEDIDLAVAAARRSFDARVWRGMSGDSRSRILWKWAELIDANSQELAHLEVLDNGMPLSLATWMVTTAAAWLRHFAGLTTQIFGRNASGAVSTATDPVHAYTASEPIGVAGLIVPWNSPLISLLMKAGPALAAGCSCVAKPAENTPLSALRAGELAMDAGIPAGVFNIVTGFGPVAGAALVSHPGVDKISFTGSTAVGKQIARSCADTLKRVTLELGGKSPCVVFDDADLDSAIPGAAMAIFANTGQICFAGSRLYVQSRSFDRVVAGVADVASKLKVGNGFDPDSALGPLISDQQRRRVSEYIASGVREGGELVTGGRHPGGRGFFIEPTVFANTRPDARIMREEIFGPVVVATPFDSIDDLVRQANDTRYGLGAGIFTNDVNKAHLLAERISAGNVWVNCYGMMHPAMPFGGFRESGWGREMSMEGVEAYLEKKSVLVKLRPS